VGGIGSDDINGGAGNDSINGAAGDDRINGGYGNDMLTGGTGKDTFVFADTLNKTRNLDTITDFSVADDSIWLENAIFGKLGTGTLSQPGMLNSAFFTIGDKAKDNTNCLTFNKATEHLYEETALLLRHHRHKQMGAQDLARAIETHFHSRLSRSCSLAPGCFATYKG
jgi:hypothetical protein